MLVETRKKHEVITVKLAASEELICSFEEDDGNYLTVDRPFIVAMVPQGAHTCH